MNGRLFRHDCRIAINTARSTFFEWHDRLFAGIVLLALLAVLRSWFLDRPWAIAAWTAFGAGTVVGVGAGRLVLARLAFHGSDGLLAADALHPSTRRRYMAAWHGMGIALVAAVTLIARPTLLMIGVGAYLAGILVAGLTDNLGVAGRRTGRTRLGWAIRASLRRPAAGISAAVILLLSLLPARTLDTNALWAMIGIEAVMLAAALTIVDDGAVRFMTLAGHGSRRVVLDHAKAMASFAVLAVPGCWLARGYGAAAVVGVVCMAMLLLLAMRVLAYRLHGRRFADLLVSIFAGLLALVAYSMPILLPFAAAFVLWHLGHRGAAKTWMLA